LVETRALVLGAGRLAFAYEPLSFGSTSSSGFIPAICTYARNGIIPTW